MRARARGNEGKQAGNSTSKIRKTNDRDLVFSTPLAMDAVGVAPLSERPSPETILAQWESFYANPLLSSSQLSSEAIAGRIPQRGLRSLHWRVSTLSRFD